MRRDIMRQATMRHGTMTQGAMRLGHGDLFKYVYYATSKVIKCHDSSKQCEDKPVQFVIIYS